MMFWILNSAAKGLKSIKINELHFYEITLITTGLVFKLSTMISKPHVWKFKLRMHCYHTQRFVLICGKNSPVPKTTNNLLANNIFEWIQPQIQLEGCLVYLKPTGQFQQAVISSKVNGLN